jgi:methanethiol oxidase
MRTISKLAAVLGASALIAVSTAVADETCMSPYLTKIMDQEDYVYVWTLGVEGMGDGEDKLVTIGANPERKETYGKVVSSTSVGGRHEAHHGGLSDDRRHFWGGGLADNQIFIFDIAASPSKPKLVKTIKDFEKASGGVVGPHTFYALPGRMLISGLSNAKDKGGKTALVEYNNDGEYIATYWMPDDAPYGYDARIQPNLNRLLTSSFTGWNNYMRDLPDLMGDAEAMKNFGHTMVVWDFHARKPIQTLAVPGAPLEIRWALQPRNQYAFTSTALTSKLWLVEPKADGTFQATEVADIGDPSKTPLPVDISISADDKYLFVDSFMDGMVRVFDVSNPRKPKVIHEKKIGAQVNMVSQTWDGKRVYFSSSLLSKWDKTGKDNEQFVKAFSWDGKQLSSLFEVDFTKEKLGRPHMMRFGQDRFYENQIFAEGAEDAADDAVALVR